MPSIIDIANRALYQISSREQVSSVTPSDGSEAANAVAILFQPTFEMIARSAHWNCLRKQAVLTLLKAASGTPENPNGTLPQPLPPWNYSYAYPSDCLLERYLVDGSTFSSSVSSAPVFTNLNWSNSNLASGAIPFVVSYDTDSNGNPIRVILTDLSQAQAVYTVNQSNPDGWDSQLQEAVVSALGACLVPALTGNTAMYQMAQARAEKIVMEARRTDGDEGLMVVDNIPDWIRVRGTNWAPGWNAYVTGYQSMSWPAL